MTTARATIAAGILLLGVGQLKADDAFACPVTKISGPKFVPPEPWRSDGTSFGTEKLWTNLSLWEYWRTDEWGYLLPKVVWFSTNFDWSPGHWLKPPSLLTITGRRLDGPSDPLYFDRANDSWEPRAGPFIGARVHLPTAGCWEITGRYKEDHVTFVVKIGP